MKYPLIPFVTSMLLIAGQSAVADWGELGDVHITPAAPDANSQVTLHISGEKSTPCHLVNNELVIDGQDIDVSLSISRDERSPDACAQVVTPFHLSLPLGKLPEGDYQVNVAQADDCGTLETAFSVGAARAGVQISPPSGEYATTQLFDMAILVTGSDSPIVDGQVLLGHAGTPRDNWQDVTPDVLECLIPGQLEQGQSLRCPALPATLFGPGKHQVHARLIIENGEVLQGSVLWEIHDSTE